VGWGFRVRYSLAENPNALRLGSSVRRFANGGRGRSSSTVQVLPAERKLVAACRALVLASCRTGYDKVRGPEHSSRPDSERFFPALGQDNCRSPN